MRSDEETLAANRQAVLEDLRKYLRRARSETPVVNPEDIGIIRNTVHPALEMPKFGEAGLFFLLHTPNVDFWMIKESGWLEDVGEGMWSGVKTLGGGLYDLGKGVYHGLTSIPTGIVRGVEGAIKGWNEGEGVWAPLKAMSGGIGGLLSPVSDVAQDAYRGLKGVVGGTVGAAVPGATLLGREIMKNPTAAKALGYADIGGSFAADLAPYIASAWIPAAGQAALAGRLVSGVNTAALLGTGVDLLAPGAAPPAPAPVPELPQGQVAQLPQGALGNMLSAPAANMGWAM